MINTTIEKTEEININKKLPQGWAECLIEDVLEYEQPTKYLVASKNYDDAYETPVLTAGKSFILGYTKEAKGIFDSKKLPVIIFDDFTTATKIVNFPFKVKSSAMKILHANKYSNIMFMYYLMQTIQYKSDTHKRYWISEYAKQTFKMPPLPEQERIVDKIEELFSDIDAGVKNLEITKLQIKQYRRSILKSAFEGRLYKTTEWKKVQLKEISDAIGGYAFKSESFSEKGYQIIRMSNIKPFALNLNERPIFIKNLPENIKEKYSLKINDLIISLTGTRKKRDYGYVTIIKSEGLLLNQRLARLRFNKDCCTEYFLYALQSEPYQTQFFAHETGNVGQGNVGMRAITEEYINFPTVPEQQKIVEEIEKRFEVADILERAVDEGLEKAKQLKQSILKKAFEGKLVPQNPNDEPVSILLEKIKAEKNNNKAKKGG